MKRPTLLCARIGALTAPLFAASTPAATDHPDITSREIKVYYAAKKKK